MTRDMEPEWISERYLSRVSRFVELKKCFIRISGPHVTKEVLDNLKEFYSQVIASKREEDRVKNLEELLKILEKRDALRYDDIEPLKQIANGCIKDAILSRTLANYEAEVKELQPLPVFNHYKFGEYFVEETENLVIIEIIEDDKMADIDDKMADINDKMVEINDKMAEVCEELLEGEKSFKELGKSSAQSQNGRHWTPFLKSRKWRCLCAIGGGVLMVLITFFVYFRREAAAGGTSRGVEVLSRNSYGSQGFGVPYANPTEAGPALGRSSGGVQEKGRIFLSK